MTSLRSSRMPGPRTNDIKSENPAAEKRETRALHNTFERKIVVSSLLKRPSNLVVYLRD